MKSFLFVLNDGPYGNERCYNALRMAAALSKQPDVSIRVFLLGEAVFCTLRNQETPDGFFNIGRMLRLLTSRGSVAT
jgi:uncharacterized protein involved in oxidation of intracellular sulfur